MKFKTTQKAVKEGYRTIIYTGYCDLANLLYYENPVAYTCGVYGWNADIYDVGRGVAICTGYRPFGTIRADYKLVEEYDNIAREFIAYSRHFDFENVKEELKRLLNEFVEKAKEE